MQEFEINEFEALFTEEAAANYNMRIDLKPIEDQKTKRTMKRAMGSPSSTAVVFSTKSEMIPLPVGVTPARCGYRTGKCQNLQAVKRNGKLHKLCEFHREKANMNQKKLDRKKRLQRSSPYDSFSSEDDAKSCDEYSPRSIDDCFDDFVVEAAPTSLNEAPLALGYEELAIFCSLMTFDLNQRRSFAQPPRAFQPYMHTV